MPHAGLICSLTALLAACLHFEMGGDGLDDSGTSCSSSSGGALDGVTMVTKSEPDAPAWTRSSSSSGSPRTTVAEGTQKLKARRLVLRLA